MAPMTLRDQEEPGRPDSRMWSFQQQQQQSLPLQQQHLMQQQQQQLLQGQQQSYGPTCLSKDPICQQASPHSGSKLLHHVPQSLSGVLASRQTSCGLSRSISSSEDISRPQSSSSSSSSNVGFSLPKDRSLRSSNGSNGRDGGYLEAMEPRPDVFAAQLLPEGAAAAAAAAAGAGGGGGGLSGESNPLPPDELALGSGASRPDEGTSFGSGGGLCTGYLGAPRGGSYLRLKGRSKSCFSAADEGDAASTADLRRVRFSLNEGCGLSPAAAAASAAAGTPGGSRRVGLQRRMSDGAAAARGIPDAAAAAAAVAAVAAAGAGGLGSSSQGASGFLTLSLDAATVGASGAAQPSDVFSRMEVAPVPEGQHKP